ncbi:uncharacterized protein [Dermacentor andersoni]|uniref:uncharacterized protein n=1 Tax=Dermacentor andersoni TaxID=34620 RepID=UPI002417080B|nr:uncharacterized protein LOC126533226 [Dermacentor andersoni]
MRRFLHEILSFGSDSSHRHHEAQETEEGDRRTSVSDMTTTTVGPSAHSPPLSASIVGFAIDLYRQLVLHTGAAGSHGASGKGAGTPGNVVFSPFAVAAALSMTLAGARYGTAKELEAALHTRDDEQIHSQFAAQLARITSRALKVVFEVNNRMYSDLRYPVIEGYRAFLHDTYGEDTVRTVDFSFRHGEVLAEANDCVARASSNTVRDVVGSDSFGPNTELALVSGAYFCGAWESPFQVVTFDESVYLSDDEVRSELRKQGYGEVSYSVLQQFKCDFQRRIREEIRKGVNTSTPLVNGAQYASEQAKGSTSSAKQARFDSSSLFDNVTYSSCYSSPYYESQRSDSGCKQGDYVTTAKPPRKVVPAPRNHVKPEASSSCYSTPAGSSCEQTTASSKGSDRSGDGLVPRLLHRKVLRCCNGHAYISERSTLSTDSQALTGSVLESFKENYSNLDDTLPKRLKPATLPLLKGEPIHKDLIKPPKGTMLSLLKVSGTKVMWNKGPHKCDPVTRYHEYKAFWERHKAPGEKAHKQLRWNVRAQMLQRDDVVACSWRPAITKEPPATRLK